MTTAKTAAARDSLSDCRLARATRACCRGGTEVVAASGMGRVRGAKGTPKNRLLSNKDNGLRRLMPPRLFPIFRGVTSRPFLAVVHYDGAPFAGWQRQAEGRTVQAEFEEVLARLLGRRTSAVGAGRTDTGVHPLGQGVGFLADDRWAGDAAGLRRAPNALLPPAVWARRGRAVRAGLHGRQRPQARG